MFWRWSNTEFSHVIHENAPPEGLCLADPVTLVVFGQNRLKVFDLDTFECVRQISMQKPIQELRNVREGKLLVVAQDESFLTVDVENGHVDEVSRAKPPRVLVFLKDLQLLLDPTDIADIKAIQI